MKSITDISVNPVPLHLRSNLFADTRFSWPIPHLISGFGLRKPLGTWDKPMFGVFSCRFFVVRFSIFGWLVDFGVLVVVLKRGAQRHYRI